MIELEINKDGEYCKKLKGAGRKWPIDDRKVILEICEETPGLTYAEATKVLEQAKERARLQEEGKVNPAEVLEDAIKQINPFKNLRIIESTKFLVIWEKNNKIEILGPLDMLNNKKLSNILTQWEPERTHELMALGKYINPKNPFLVSLEDIIQICINNLNLRSTLPRTVTDDEDIHPAVVEGLDIPALRRIPYIQKEVSFCDMNDYLTDFLTRVDNHKHLCAVLWGQFTGKKWPYICYLYGKDGREGKTSFINMLGNLTKSYATLTDEGRFSLFPLYGKSIIMVPENDKSRLVSNKTVKAITGGSLLSIEEKGRTGFSGMIRGTLIVDANVPLNISGKSFETERLLYLAVSKNNTPKEKRISPDEYTKIMGSTPNEFLNYCRQCYEELLSEGGMLKEPENHKQIMESLSDYVEDYEFGQLLNKLAVHFDSERSYDKAKLVSEAREKSGKKTFYQTSFLYYLEKHGVKEDGKNLVGICKKSQSKLEDLDKQLKEALPK